MYLKSFKRLFDLFFSAFLLIALSPLLLLVAVCIKLFMGGPILFTQRRAGYKGNIFLIYKFKTMSEQRDEAGRLLPDKYRLTWFGSTLRKWSIDELPGLINVLRGEMSVIGPRPQIAEYLAIYTKEEMKRHNVLPGITGWAQVNGRNTISWEEKFKLDVWYVDNISFYLDLKIVFMTVYKVLICHGVNEPGQATVTPLKRDIPDDKKNKLKQRKCGTIDF